MRYAVIESDSNQWVYDGDDKADAERHYRKRAVVNVPCVLVRVLADTEADMPDVFGDVKSED
jgi:hypothetical protein